ncbi:MAG: DUF6268 family outer membrane beta-barrel protein [Planctomycetes bacterium]|nr:DUF6268 family outer membrane beta-barrel protein [Planctomycetota bacterium]MCC7397128.1 hypothetical protein [Planctomycetota bacterium]
MRNPPARVVLAACLAAASVAAQAPVSPSPAVDPITGERSAKVPAGYAASPASLFDRTIVGTQEPQDYSMWAEYRRNHGEFVDRMQRYDPQVEFRIGAAPDLDLRNEPGEFDLYNYGADIKLPVLVSTEGYLLLGGYGDTRRYLFTTAAGSRGNPAGVHLDDKTLTGAGLTFGAGVFLDDNWLFEAYVQPGVWSDLDAGLKHKDFDFPGQALFTWRTMPEFFFKFGARYNQVYHDAPWLPMLGFSWEITEGFRFDLLLPEHLEFSFWPTSNTGILFGVDVDGGEYHVRTSAATGNQQGDVHVQEISTYFGWMTRFNENTSLLLRGGLVVSGDYYLTTGRNNFDPAEGSLNQGLFAEVSFGFDF